MVSSDRITKIAKNISVLNWLKGLEVLGHTLEEGRIMNVS